MGRSYRQLPATPTVQVIYLQGRQLEVVEAQIPKIAIERIDMTTRVAQEQRVCAIREPRPDRGHALREAVSDRQGPTVDVEDRIVCRVVVVVHDGNVGPLVQEDLRHRGVPGAGCAVEGIRELQLHSVVRLGLDEDLPIALVAEVPEAVLAVALHPHPAGKGAAAVEYVCDGGCEPGTQVVRAPVEVHPMRDALGREGGRCGPVAQRDGPSRRPLVVRDLGSVVVVRLQRQVDDGLCRIDLAERRGGEPVSNLGGGQDAVVEMRLVNGAIEGPVVSRSVPDVQGVGGVGGSGSGGSSGLGHGDRRTIQIEDRVVGRIVAVVRDDEMVQDAQGQGPYSGGPAPVRPAPVHEESKAGEATGLSKYKHKDGALVVDPSKAVLTIRGDVEEHLHGAASVEDVVYRRMGGIADAAGSAVEDGPSAHYGCVARNGPAVPCDRIVGVEELPEQDTFCWESWVHLLLLG